MGELAMKHMCIQRQLNAPKGNFNKFGGYAYRSCEDILEALKPILSEQRCTITISDSVVMIGDRYYVEATATLHDCESADAVSCTAYAREADDKKGMDAAQVTGAASSYARKYALNGLFCIDDTKDADTMDNSGAAAPKKSTPKSKPAQATQPTPAPVQAEAAAQPTETDPAMIRADAVSIKQLFNDCEAQGVNVPALCTMYKVAQLHELSVKQYNHIISNWDRVKNMVKGVTQ